MQNPYLRKIRTIYLFDKLFIRQVATVEFRQAQGVTALITNPAHTIVTIGKFASRPPKADAGTSPTDPN